MLKQIIHGFYDLVYPQNCFICKKRIAAPIPHAIVCHYCQGQIPWNRPPFCLKCSRHLPMDYHHPFCRDCRKVDLHFDFAWSACLYRDSIRTLIHKFKYGQKAQLHRYLSSLMAQFVDQYTLDIKQFDMIIPIPLYWSRQRERGYNQAGLLADCLAKTFELPLKVQILARARPTYPQALLERKNRWTNIEGAFRIKHSKDLKNMSILLIDDLLTTGATASQAAYTLKAAGAKRIGVFTLAIAPIY